MCHCSKVHTNIRDYEFQSVYETIWSIKSALTNFQRIVLYHSLIYVYPFTKMILPWLLDLLVCLCLFEIGSLLVIQSGLEHTMSLRLASNSWWSFPAFLSSGITEVHHHPQLTNLWDSMQSRPWTHYVAQASFKFAVILLVLPSVLEWHHYFCVECAPPPHLTWTLLTSLEIKYNEFKLAFFKKKFFKLILVFWFLCLSI